MNYDQATAPPAIISLCCIVLIFKPLSNKLCDTTMILPAKLQQQLAGGGAVAGFGMPPAEQPAQR